MKLSKIEELLDITEKKIKLLEGHKSSDRTEQEVIDYVYDTYLALYELRRIKRHNASEKIILPEGTRDNMLKDLENEATDLYDADGSTWHVVDYHAAAKIIEKYVEV